MKLFIPGIILASAIGAHAEIIQTIKIQNSDVNVSAKMTRDGAFSNLSVQGFETSKEVGAPELPLKSWLVQARPESIQVNVKTKTVKTLTNFRPAPVQPQDCRCDTPKKVLQFNINKYSEAKPEYSVTYLGAFRGQPVSRVDVNMASFDAAKNEVLLKQEVSVEINENEFSFESKSRAEYRDYLLLVPKDLAAGVTDFVTYKKNQGYNVIVESLETPQVTLANMAALVKSHYQADGTDFVMIIGDETRMPMNKVETSGSYTTPTDLMLYTMDGKDDYIPDMFASRIPSATVDGVKKQLQKSIDFEQKNYVSSTGLKKIVGIASNEGSNPSDKDYVMAIEKEFVSGIGADPTFLFQNDKTNSNPAGLNNKLNIGAVWLTYLGHGSGTSWPSMATAYATSNIKQLKNQPSVKPIIIDVACMNGKLASGYLGTTFMEVGSSSDFGAAAYYGGTVNISWHPPAVMAKGIAIEHMAKNFKHLGEALMAGQMYLAGKWASVEEVRDNFEWYHLQGDPGMNVQFK